MYIHAIPTVPGESGLAARRRCLRGWLRGLEGIAPQRALLIIMIIIINNNNDSNNTTDNNYYYYHYYYHCYYIA